MKLLIRCSEIDFYLGLSFKASISLTIAFYKFSIDSNGNLSYSNQLLFMVWIIVYGLDSYNYNNNS